MRVNIIRIGNSQGVRIPKPLIEEVGLAGEIEMSVEGSALVLRPAKRVRAGWDEAFAAMHAAGDDVMLDELTENEFDETEWTWE